jgi:hypothetical protein
MCATAVLFLARHRPNVQQQQHELLIAFAVRGLLPAPWSPALRSGLTVFR